MTHRISSHRSFNKYKKQVHNGGDTIQDDTLKLIHDVIKQLQRIYNYKHKNNPDNATLQTLSELQSTTKRSMEQITQNIYKADGIIRNMLKDNNYLNNNGTRLNLIGALKLKIKNSIAKFENNPVDRNSHTSNMAKLYKSVLFLEVADEFLNLPDDSLSEGISFQNVVDARKRSRIEKDAKNKQNLFKKYIHIIGDKQLSTRKNYNSNQYKAYRTYKQKFSELNPANNNTQYRARRFVNTLKDFKNTANYKAYIKRVT